MENPEILRLRAELDNINKELLELLALRLSVAEKVLNLKSDEEIAHYDENRVNNMLVDLKEEFNQSPYPERYWPLLENLFKQIFDISLKL